MFNFLLKNRCHHDKITPNMKLGYCPDCGAYVENHWYISRCKCCSIKQKTNIKNGKFCTETKFCKNCGSGSFEVEEIESPDIVTINYAAVRKITVRQERRNLIQTWIEQNSYSAVKLLPSY